MKVLSLFDGISCGMVALERAGIPVEKYVAYEIDEDAIKVSKYNYPQIEQKGDVFKAEYTEGEFDLLIGGSPCTYWSIAKAGYGRETTSSGMGFDLFMQYVRALKEVKPKYFLYENNESMSDAIKEEITKQLGVEPILIDSADFSAQHRKRLYWTNIPVNMQWEKSDLLFEDIMQHDVEHKTRNFEKWKDTVKVSKDGMNVRYDTSGKGHYGQGNRAKKPNQKWNTLPAAGSNTKNDIWAEDYVSWHITSIEMERLQTLPDGYTSCLNSDIKSMRCCGNGWTVDVIAHIFTYLKKEKENKMELKVKTPTFPEVIEFNFEELRQEIEERTKSYANLVYAEDQMKQAKTDVANLRKFTKALSDERIKIKKECMKPYEDFESKIKELDGIVNKAITNIDNQIKAAEEQKKTEKKEKILELFKNTLFPDWVKFEQIFDARWLNASVSMASITKELIARSTQIADDIITLSNMPEFGFEAGEVYKTTLDINSALNEGKRLAEIQKRKAEAERMRAEAEAKKQQEEQLPGQITFTDAESFENNCIVPKVEEKPFEECMNPPVEEREWVGFKAYLTEREAVELADFFNSRNIEYKAV